METKPFLGEPEHFSVATVITNPKRNLFYLQQKDEGCPIKEFRLTYCFFGGALEKNEDEFSALKRELSEELSDYAAKVITENARKLFEDYLLNIFKQKSKFTLYESVLPDNVLKIISKHKVKEGKGFLINREDILKIKFLPDLESTLDKYLHIISLKT